MFSLPKNPFSVIFGISDELALKAAATAIHKLHARLGRRSTIIVDALRLLKAETSTFRLEAMTQENFDKLQKDIELILKSAEELPLFIPANWKGILRSSVSEVLEDEDDEDDDI